MNCETCTHRPDPVPFAVHESAMARQERTIRRLWILLLVLVALLVGSNALWIWYESQFEDVTDQWEFDVDQETSDGGSNYVIGRDFSNGKANGESQENADNAIP